MAVAGVPGLAYPLNPARTMHAAMKPTFFVLLNKAHRENKSWHTAEAIDREEIVMEEYESGGEVFVAIENMIVKQASAPPATNVESCSCVELMSGE